MNNFGTQRLFGFNYISYSCCKVVIISNKAILRTTEERFSITSAEKRKLHLHHVELQL